MNIKLSDMLINRLIRRNIISDSDSEIYKFGVEQLGFTVINMITIVILGMVFGEVLEGLLFALSFMSLRSVAGGFHASTATRCYLLTTVVIVTVLSVMKFMDLGIEVYGFIYIISGTIIILLSPVESENKPLDKIEEIVYRRRTWFLLGIQSVCVMIAYYINADNLVESIILAQFVLSLSLIIGEFLMKNRQNT
jgi:accessory gene regulator B